MKAFNDTESTLTARTILMLVAALIMFYWGIAEVCIHLFD